MRRQVIHSFLAFGLVFCAFGCDKACKKAVQDFATVQNLTGRPMIVSVCKSWLEKSEVQMPILEDRQSHEVDVGTHDETVVKGGLDAGKTCPAFATERSATNITLSEKSFDQVKLCRDPASKLYALIETNQPCPTGFDEQAAADHCGDAVASKR